MINHNLLLYSLFDKQFSVQFNVKFWEVNYTEGDLFELNKKLLMSQTKYPIIWLQTGYTVGENTMSKRITLNNCKFFLITKGDQHDLYKKRYETNYQNMLFPLYEKFKDVIKRTKGISITDEMINFVELPMNDVTGMELTPQKATVPDIWDAIMIEGLNLEINEDCFPQFKIKK